MSSVYICLAYSQICSVFLLLKDVVSNKLYILFALSDSLVFDFLIYYLHLGRYGARVMSFSYDGLKRR